MENKEQNEVIIDNNDNSKEKVSNQEEELNNEIKENTMSNKEEPMNVDIVTDVNNEKENESNKVEVEETVPTEAEYSKSFSFQKFMGKVMFDDVTSIFVQKNIGVINL